MGQSLKAHQVYNEIQRKWKFSISQILFVFLGHSNVLIL